MPADLFIGLVTYPRSRFPEAASPQGLMQRVAGRAKALGLEVITHVIHEDLLDPSSIQLDRRAIESSITAELDVERRWREYVAGKPLSLNQSALMRLRHAKRRLDLVPPWKRELKPNDPGPRMLIRLANIELAHLAIMQAAVDSQARWALLLEDDAQSDGPEAFTDQLIDFFKAADAAGEPKTINLSESFTIDQLGIRHLLNSRSNPGQPAGWTTYRAERLVTNTVCAVLYERQFLQELITALRDILMEPVIPIDFKVNAAYMTMTQEPGECWVCSPAPIRQGSGVPQPKM